MNLYNLVHALMRENINFRYQAGTDAFNEDKVWVTSGHDEYWIEYLSPDEFAVAPKGSVEPEFFTMQGVVWLFTGGHL